MKHISRLQITIAPWTFCGDMKQLHVETIVNGMRHEVAVPFEPNDFESCFDRLMEDAKREIIRLVKAHKA